jgi:hypothetical protein
MMDRSNNDERSTMQRKTLIRTALAAGVLALSACAMAPPANVAMLGATLSGAQEVPPNTRTGMGMADIKYNRDTGMLSWSVTYSGLTGPVTGAHIHGPAGPGANAGIVVPFAPGPSPITGEAKITPAQAGDLQAGLWYVNLHTAAHPPGEIRGQIGLKR